MRTIRIVLIFMLMAAFPTAAYSQTDEVGRIGVSDGWLRLLHYRKRLLGWRSQLNDPNFFSSRDGYKDPVGELRAAIEVFAKAQATPESDERIECRFPARFYFLKREVPAAKSWKMPACEHFDRFFEGTHPQSATLVFSSYFLNNPASAFGHTFLRLNRNSDGQPHQPLLDYGIGFAANAEGSNALTFALGGLFGLFPGVFTSVPYYFKVQEYNNFESRDLWEYDLNLSREEVAQLTRHLWELSHTTIKYHYLSMNC